MQHLANELLEETPMRVSSATAQLVASEGASNVLVSRVLGLGSLAIFGVLLIIPGCGQPT